LAKSPDPWYRVDVCGPWRPPFFVVDARRLTDTNHSRRANRRRKGVDVVSVLKLVLLNSQFCSCGVYEILATGNELVYERLQFDVAPHASVQDMGLRVPESTE